MEPQYCSKLGSRWQTFLQQYGGLTLKTPMATPLLLNLSFFNAILV